MPVTHGVVGKHRSCRCPAPCNLLPERGQIVAGEKLCRQNFFGPGGLSFRKRVWICLFKRDYAWEIMLLMFYRTALPMGRIVTSVASICHISVLFSHIDIRQKLRADLSLRFTVHDTAVCLVGRKDKHLGNLYVCRG